MSPEQVGGDRLDRRTDLFSLGVVLYECVTGQQPFQGKTSAVILASILTQQPKPPRELNGNIPIGLQDTINACLEKDRELRYQDAGSLRADLKRVKRDLDSGGLGVAHTTATASRRPFETSRAASRRLRLRSGRQVGRRPPPRSFPSRKTGASSSGWASPRSRWAPHSSRSRCFEARRPHPLHHKVQPRHLRWLRRRRKISRRLRPTTPTPLVVEQTRLDSTKRSSTAIARSPLATPTVPVAR